MVRLGIFGVKLKTVVAVSCCPGCGGSCNMQMVPLRMRCSSRRVLKTGFGIVKFVNLHWPLWLGAEVKGLQRLLSVWKSRLWLRLSL
eukprot:5085497-Amphidinium_carterae.1